MAGCAELPPLSDAGADASPVCSSWADAELPLSVSPLRVTAFQLVPFTASAPVLEGVPCGAVAAGGDSSFAVSSMSVVLPAGILFAWGNGRWGALGLGEAAVSAALPAPVALPAEVLQLRSSGLHTVALLAPAVVWGWGDNRVGQAGTGLPGGTVWLPQAIPALAGTAIVGVAVGHAHSLAVSDEGEVLACALSCRPSGLFVAHSTAGGSNLHGQCGTAAGAESISSLQPSRRLLSVVEASTNAVSVRQFGALVSASPLTMGDDAASPAPLSIVPVPVRLLSLQQVSTLYAAGDRSWALVAACPPGSTQTASGECEHCPAGSTGLGGQSPCILCAAGSFSPLAGSTTCIPCSAGSFSNAAGTASCTPCAALTYLPFPGGTSLLQCLPCPVASVSPSGSAGCKRCAAGTYASPGGCAGCPVGTFQPLAGAAASLADCILCPRGSFGSTEAASACKPCPPGTFADMPGVTGCTACGPGTYSGAGQSECTQCPAGTFLDASNSTSAVDCTLCPAGSYSDSEGAALCLPCAPGSWSAKFSTTCELCPPGTASDIPGAQNESACLPCPSGQHSRGSGASSCADCPAGTYASGEGAVRASTLAPGSELTPLF